MMDVLNEFLLFQCQIYLFITSKKLIISWFLMFI